jgi:hypothetical protein
MKKNEILRLEDRNPWRKKECIWHDDRDGTEGCFWLFPLTKYKFINSGW